MRSEGTLHLDRAVLVAPPLPGTPITGLAFPVSCPNCDGSLDVRASSAVQPSHVSAVLDCVECGAEVVIHVTLSATGPRKRRGSPFRHPSLEPPAQPATQNHAAEGAPLLRALLAAKRGAR